MALISKLQTRFAHSERERGAVLVLTALVMMLLLFIAAFATDLGAWYRQGQEQQRAADVGALNGVQAYDRATKAYFETVTLDDGSTAKTWVELRAHDLAYGTDHVSLAEADGLEAAANTIIGLLETSGLSFSGPGEGVIAKDPLDINQVSTWTVVADDGTEVVITRSWIDTNGVSTRSIDVVINAPGEQYFSNILRDAPEIERSASSVLSNCGAVCDQEIIIHPPFAGFDAASSGDGFQPLLFNKDGNSYNGYEEIWAVNHHASANGLTNGDPNARNSNGDIVCMVTATKEPCLGFDAGGNGVHFDIEDNYPGLQTANFPQDYIDEDTGIILFGARDQVNKNAGIACFNAATRSPCSTKYIAMFTAAGNINASGGWYNAIQVHAVYRNPGTDDFFAFGQDGTWACARLAANTTMTNCGTGDTAAVGTDMPGMDRGGRRFKSDAEQIGSKLYLRQTTLTTSGNNRHHKFHCFDMATTPPAPCASWGGAKKVNANIKWSNTSVLFLARNTSGTPQAVCMMNTSNNAANTYCRNLSNGAGWTGLNAGLSTAMGGDRKGNWSGDEIYWTGELSNGTITHRTFFSTGQDNRVVCWDWTSNTACGVLNPGTDSGGTTIKPYDFAIVTGECIIGLSDRAVFFSFNPDGMAACVDTKLTTTIEPCACTPSGNRWGEIRLPAELLNKVSSLEATVTDPSTGTVWFDDDIFTDGVINLTHVPDTLAGPFELELSIEALLVGGVPAFADPITADLEIVVQPTLTN